MIFSLIIGTLNRSTELEICLDSLLRQSIHDFEIIIVDQSDNNLTHELINNSKYNKLDIKYFHVTFKGLSKARNFGLAKSSGRYFALIDDDAAYDESYFENANNCLKDSEKLILSGLMISRDGKEYFHYNQDTKIASTRDIMRYTPSPGLIFPFELYEMGLLFDDNFGVGSMFGACEETDLILEAIDRGYKVMYVKKMRYIHPTMNHTFEIENYTRNKKIENYAIGLGALFAKDMYSRKSNKLWMIIIEKYIKLFIKRMGILGKKKKEEAIFEKKGIISGFNRYRDQCINE